MNKTWSQFFTSLDGLTGFDLDICHATREESLNLQGTVTNVTFSKVGIVANGCQVNAFSFSRQVL